MAALIDDFVDDLPRRIRDIEQAALQADMKRLCSMAEQLDAAADATGFQAIAYTARTLDHLAHDDADLSKLQETVDQLIGLCRLAQPTCKRRPQA